MYSYTQTYEYDRCRHTTCSTHTRTHATNLTSTSVFLLQVPGKDYVFEFQITNPIESQDSPQISIEGQIQGKASSTDLQFFSRAGTSKACQPCVDAAGVSCSQHVMDKDTKSVLCCTSCSYLGVAVAADAARVSSGLLDGQTTRFGDAEPLKIHTPFFCLKKIGQVHMPHNAVRKIQCLHIKQTQILIREKMCQDSCYPCDNNTVCCLYSSLLTSPSAAMFLQDSSVTNPLHCWSFSSWSLLWCSRLLRHASSGSVSLTEACHITN